MSLLSIFAGIAFVSVAITVFVAAPIAGLLAVRSGAIDVGLTTAITDPTRLDLAAVPDLETDERLVALTVPERSGWLPILGVGLVTIPFGWGIALIVYALRLRSRPRYVFTEDRLLIDRPDETESIPLDDVSQIQTGVTTLESFVNRGHVTFLISDVRLETIPYLTDSEEFVNAITAAKATRSSTSDRAKPPTA